MDRIAVIGEWFVLLIMLFALSAFVSVDFYMSREGVGLNSFSVIRFLLSFSIGWTILLYMGYFPFYLIIIPAFIITGILFIDAFQYLGGRT